MPKAEGHRGRSGLSDITPSPGPGYILLTQQDRDSLSRCTAAAEALFGSPQSKFHRFKRSIWEKHLAGDALANLVHTYWYDDAIDRRTKASDLKRELLKVVTHLAPLIAAINNMPSESKHALNRMMRPPTRDEPDVDDIFGKAEALNRLILERCKSLVEPKFTKQAATSTANACKALAAVWQAISKQRVDRNTKVDNAKGEKLIKDRYTFQSDGMHFIHVMLQAIDTDATYSKVRTGMRRVAARNPKGAINRNLQR